MVSNEFPTSAELPGMVSLVPSNSEHTAALAETPDANQLSEPIDSAAGYELFVEAATKAKSALTSRKAHAGGQFVLGQNFPDPYTDTTTVPFSLLNPADVVLEIFDALGRKIFSVVRKGMEPGEHTIALNLLGLGTASGNYSYQLKVTNKRGTYRQSKMMTAAS